MGNIGKKWISLLLVLALCAGMVPGVLAADSTVENAAFGPADCGGAAAKMLEAWTNDALSQSEVQTLLNSQTLYPQKTGWDKLDELLESMLAKAPGEDAYSKLWYMYNWLVKNVTYNWEGYSYTYASVGAYNSVTGYNFLSAMTYDGQKKSIPDDMVNRTYHILAARKGVCYDYAIAFTVIARYVGIESYIRTGYFTFEDTYNGVGHHGWSVLMLSGKEYIFDPQREARNWQYYGRTGYYFGIPETLTYRYKPSYSADDRTNNQTLADSMLPVTTDRKNKLTLSILVEGNGTVTGAGEYEENARATLTATPAEGSQFVGWYAASGHRLGNKGDASITIVVQWNTTVTARFEKVASYPEVDTTQGGSLDNFQRKKTFQPDQFQDVTEADWFFTNVAAAFEFGLMLGTDDGSFGAGDVLTIGQTLAIADRLHNIYYGGSGVFIQGDPWYQVYVDYAVQYGIITAEQAGQYDPTEEATRAQFAQIMDAAFPAEALAAIRQVSSIPDVTPDMACYKAVLRLYNACILQGDDNGNFLPDNQISREQVAAIATRFADPTLREEIFLATSKTEIPDPDSSEAETDGEDGEQTEGELDDEDGGKPDTETPDTSNSDAEDAESQDASER